MSGGSMPHFLRVVMPFHIPLAMREWATPFQHFKCSSFWEWLPSFLPKFLRTTFQPEIFCQFNNHCPLWSPDQIMGWTVLSYLTCTHCPLCFLTRMCRWGFNASDHELSTSEGNMGHCFCIFPFSWCSLLSSARRKRLGLWRRHCCLVLGTRWVRLSCLLAPGSWPSDGGGEERIAGSIFCTVKPKMSNSVQNMP